MSTSQPEPATPPEIPSAHPYGGSAVITQIAGLAVRTWERPGRDEPVVLALHGLTSTSAVWADLAERLPGVTLIAPDLPGRGLSVTSPAAPGLPGLAAAVAAVVDALGLRRVVVVGHSMGAFLVPLVVDRLGDRVAGVVLVDGGVSPEPSRLQHPLIVRALFTLQMRRLERTWSDVDRFTAAADGAAAAGHPELDPQFRGWSEAVLEPVGGGWRPRLDRRRIVADAVDTLGRAPHLDKLQRPSAPVHLIAARHGADDTKAAFLSDAAIAAGERTIPRLTSQRVEANHATMLFDPATSVAITELLGRMT